MAKQRMAGEKLSGKKQKSRVNEAGNYTKPGLRKSIFNRIKAGSGQWSARKAQMMAKAAYKLMVNTKAGDKLQARLLKTDDRLKATKS